MDGLEDFKKFLESMGAKMEVKTVAISPENLVSSKTIENEDHTLEIRVYEVGDTKLTVETKTSNNKDDGFKESIQSIVDDINEELSWAVENEKFELAAELKAKRDSLVKRFLS